MITSKFLGLVILYHICLALANSTLIIVIIGQNDDYHKKNSQQLVESLIQQTNSSTAIPQIILYPQNFKDEGGWTIYSLFPSIEQNLLEGMQWVIFLEDRTKINLTLLMEALSKYDAKEEIWIGHALFDREATIIHHFAFFQNPSVLKYPNLGSGFAMSIPLFERLNQELSEQKYTPPNFHIDVSYEFTLYVTAKGTRYPLQHDELFCTKEKPLCATYPEKLQLCDKPEISPTYAVKTFHKFHKNRVQVVLKTWAQYTKDLIFFSDEEDSLIPTTKLDINNTEQGHCAKTIEILKFLDKKLKPQDLMQWIVFADDDTILSVSKISRLLSCFKSIESPIMIGERYRFSSNGDGYNYLTGGAGIAINMKAVEILANRCRCPKPDSPDDMILGACAKMLKISLVHFPQFHQARPNDYAEGYLDTMDAISFHKHWMLDPVAVYDEYFRKDDSLFYQNVSVNVRPPESRDEL